MEVPHMQLPDDMLGSSQMSDDVMLENTDEEDAVVTPTKSIILGKRRAAEYPPKREAALPIPQTPAIIYSCIEWARIALTGACLAKYSEALLYVRTEEVFDFVMAHSPCVNWVSEEREETVLQYLCKSSFSWRATAIARVLAEGAHVNRLDRLGRPCLYFVLQSAADHDDAARIVDTLLAHGANAREHWECEDLVESTFNLLFTQKSERAWLRTATSFMKLLHVLDEFTDKQKVRAMLWPSVLWNLPGPIDWSLEQWEMMRGIWREFFRLGMDPHIVLQCLVRETAVYLGVDNRMPKYESMQQFVFDHMNEVVRITGVRVTLPMIIAPSQRHHRIPINILAYNPPRLAPWLKSLQVYGRYNPDLVDVARAVAACPPYRSIFRKATLRCSQAHVDAHAILDLGRPQESLFMRCVHNARAADPEHTHADLVEAGVPDHIIDQFFPHVFE